MGSNQVSTLLFLASCSHCGMCTTTTWERFGKEEEEYEPEFKWFVGDWSSCSNACGYGLRVRPVYCVRWCSFFTSGYCPAAPAVDCLQLEVRPENEEACHGGCPDTRTVTTTTFTSTSTETATTTQSTVTITMTTPEFECGAFQDRDACVPQYLAGVRCRRRCGGNECCLSRLSHSLEDPIHLALGEAGPEQSIFVEDETEMMDVVLIVVSSIGGCIAVTLLLICWWACVRHAEKARALRPKSAVHPTYVGFSRPAAVAASTSKKDKKDKKDRKDGKSCKGEDVMFDKRLGKGVASAPPDGFFEEMAPADYFREDGTFDQAAFLKDQRDMPRSPVKKGQSYFQMDEKFYLSPSGQSTPVAGSPSNAQRRQSSSAPNSPAGQWFAEASASEGLPRWQKEESSRQRHNTWHAGSPPSTQSSPSERRRRRAKEAPPEIRVDDCGASMDGSTEDGDISTPSSKQAKSPASPSLPKGFSATSRAHRRGGKEAPSPSAHTDTGPPPMPGQANTEHDETSSRSKSSRRGMASPPRASDGRGPAATSQGFFHSKPGGSPTAKQEQPSSPSSCGRRSTAGEAADGASEGHKMPSLQQQRIPSRKLTASSIRRRARTWRHAAKSLRASCCAGTPTRTRLRPWRQMSFDI
eukprot:TRINITY_DN7014_c0_g1_i1.p1 TRINITY_DN7014_c0_g1~~TRINITY_DN7014_c0_g1_i1.p1  ORF type:complete len:639 (+),score=95.02 TRINITY_DN7014_c0_g1_i1:82-1998(+)